MDKPAAGAASKKRKPVKLLGTAHFSIPSGKTQTVTIHLNAAGRRFVRGRRKVSLLAVATINGRTESVRLTLTAKKKH